LKIAVEFPGERFEREVEVICRMFYQDPEVLFQKDQETHPDLSVSFSVTGVDPIYVRVTVCTDDERWEAEHQREAPYLVGSKEWRKRVKQSISYVLIQALEKVSGIIQPWGILTGIRPTKLFHTMLRQGQDIDQVKAVLKEDYLLTSEKTDLLAQIVNTQYAVLPDFHEINNKEVSIYIGIPFCPTKCAYCTFPAYAIDNSVEAFLAGLHFEVEKVGDWLNRNGLGVTTLYLGGGTPTSITAEQMDALFRKIKDHFPPMERIREITVEAGRPDTITAEKIEVMKKWRVDRISINPQSFTEETLEAIGRDHTVSETVEKYKLAREMGLHNINMDLIIGLPGEGVDTFAHSLEEVRKLLPESLTVHTLSFKRASTMTKNKEQYRVASREEIQQMMDMTSQWTNKQGYIPYYLYRQKNILGNLENVGYAQPEKESIYNIIIMEEIQTIIGLGCGAVSKLIEPGTHTLTRYPNPKDPRTYIETYQDLIERKLQVLSETYNHDLTGPVLSQ
jgi:oxygen-independent coproporphyrinogen-3 oxidase